MHKTSSIVAYIFGALFIMSGLWGISFTYTHISQEQIVTPPDAAYPNTHVRGPLTLNAQANIIRKHMLNMAQGKTYAELPRQIPQLDAQGQPTINDQGQPVLIDNPTRNIWITATSLMTALHLGIIAYAVSALTLALGCVMVWLGVIMHQPSLAPRTSKKA